MELKEREKISTTCNDKSDSPAVYIRMEIKAIQSRIRAILIHFQEHCNKQKLLGYYY